LWHLGLGVQLWTVVDVLLMTAAMGDWTFMDQCAEGQLLLGAVDKVALSGLNEWTAVRI